MTRIIMDRGLSRPVLAPAWHQLISLLFSFLPEPLIYQNPFQRDLGGGVLSPLLSPSVGGGRRQRSVIPDLPVG